jgi:hypothetical protein
VPEFVWPFRLDNGTRRDRGLEWFGIDRVIAEEPANSRRRQVQPGAAKHLGDLDLPESRAQQLQPLDDVSDEVRELVDGDRDLEQRMRSLLIDASLPRAEGRFAKEVTESVNQ